jgi:hypothetical protein
MSVHAASATATSPALGQGAARASVVPAAVVLVRHADFFACIDEGVRRLMADPTQIEPARSRLRAWLGGKTELLDAAGPIDFALFDTAMVGVAERLAPRDAAAQNHVLHAARVLAEAVYARN